MKLVLWLPAERHSAGFDGVDELRQSHSNLIVGKCARLVKILIVLKAKQGQVSAKMCVR